MGPVGPRSPLGPKSPFSPSWPRSPLSPLSPAAPRLPSSPLTPREPGKPTGPCAPGGPWSPLAPGSPGLPGWPGAPSAPGSPGMPDLPCGPCEAERNARSVNRAAQPSRLRERLERHSEEEVGVNLPRSSSDQPITALRARLFVTSLPLKANFALQLKAWRENMENFCGSKPPEGGCGSRQAQGFYPLWQPTASVFHGNRRFADCDPIAQFDRFDPRTTIGLPLEVRAVSRALDFLNPVSEALPQRGTRDSNPQPRVPTRSQNRKRPNAQSHRANGAAAKGNVKREKHFPEWELNFGPLGSVMRALPTEPRRHDDCTVRRVRVVFALSSWLEAAGYGKYDSNPSHCTVIVASWLSW
ncbi:IgA FC receptor [Frankliniella fusca]|uniref:IgA FC receptor n=1 Tax=Frankliniella fusca TaxID=407009 RepID=A0AAE1GQV5_9NEOP|nr:IgA FC receptor [Frankliniella fusca]